MTTIEINGRTMRTNDEDQRYLLCESRAHALRVIRWLGLTGARIVDAADEIIAAGKFCSVHSREWLRTH